MRELSEPYREPLELHEQRAADALQLRGDDGEHRDVDAVELVEAAPRAALAQPRQDLPHGAEVHPLTAVGHDAKKTKCFREVLCCLRLPRAGWPLK